MIHQNGCVCPRCTSKLALAHPEMKSFFNWLTAQGIQAHISWSFRSEAEQNEMVKRGLSKTPWPTSKHNFVNPLSNLPEAKALDLFYLDNSGIAICDDIGWYTMIAEKAKAEHLPIRWGGDFEHFKDYNHYELKEELKYYGSTSRR